jgi:hypothetical protein
VQSLTLRERVDVLFIDDERRALKAPSGIVVAEAKSTLGSAGRVKESSNPIRLDQPIVGSDGFLGL